MIVFLRGNVRQLGAGFADIDVNGVGYRVWMMERDIDGMVTHEEVLVHTHHQVREDDEALYGFLNEADKTWFSLLLSVSGIGPKGALQIASATVFDVFVEAVVMEDAGMLSKLPGIGKKTAERLILELKDKLRTGSHTTQREGTVLRSGRPAAVPQSGRMPSVRSDVIEALMSLGYNEKQAIEAVEASLTPQDSFTIEEGLRRCLAYFDSSRSRGKAGARV